MSIKTKILFSNDSKNKVKINKYVGHHRPDPSTKYFTQYAELERRTNTLSVIFPFFNEEGTDLERSLESMIEQIRVMSEYKSYNVRIVAIMDGWYKASESMKTYLKLLFPQDSGSKWWDEIEFVCRTTKEINTFIVERENDAMEYMPVNLLSGENINLSLIVKGDNRRKANSHEWFFSAFAKEMVSDYVFATDCGALYDSKCMSELLKYLDIHDDCAGATGRQRVMSSEMQGCPDEGIMEMMYRSVQAYDYETSISSYQGAFSFIGMLPVLPGPCGMYKMRDISGECLDYYFETLEKEDDSVLFGNLLLAEDRVLSYAAALKTGKYTRWVPSSIFYFEAETNVANFIAQRRRWTNGAFAGYIYLLFSENNIIENSKHSKLFKTSSWLLLSMQLLMFIFTVISPALFMAMTTNTIKDLNFFGDTTSIVSYAVLIANCFTYLVYNVTHYNIKFSKPIFTLMMSANTLSMIWVILGVLIGILRGDVLISIVIGFVIFVPMFLALIHDAKVLLLIITNFVPYMLLLPTFVFSFPSYAYMRISDLSWGNRPSNDTGSVQKTSKSLGRVFALTITLGNIISAFCLTTVVDTNVFVYAASILLIPSFIQQFISLLYYLCYTKTLFSRVWNNRGKSVFDIIGQLLSFCSLGFFIKSISTSEWIQTDKVVYNQDNGMWLANITQSYSPLMYCTTVNAKNATYSFEYPECTMWGSNIVDDLPTSFWTVTIVCMVLSILFSSTVVISTLISLFVKDKSRMISNNNLYSLFSSITSVIALIAFPLGFGAGQYIEWYYPKTLCDGGSAYNLGECEFNSDVGGAGFWYAVAGTTLTIISSASMYFGIRERRNRKKIVKQETIDTDIKFNKKYRSYLLEQSKNNSPELSIN